MSYFSVGSRLSLMMLLTPEVVIAADWWNIKLVLTLLCSPCGFKRMRAALEDLDAV